MGNLLLTKEGKVVQETQYVQQHHTVLAFYLLDLFNVARMLRSFIVVMLLLFRSTKDLVLRYGCPGGPASLPSEDEPLSITLAFCRGKVVTICYNLNIGPSK